MKLKKSGEPVVLFDTETLGDASKGKGAPSIPWQIHAIRIEKDGTKTPKTFYFEVDDSDIDPAVVKFNKYKTELGFKNMIQRAFNKQGYKDNKETYKAFSDFVQKDEMVAFRAGFDSSVLGVANKKWGSPVKSIINDAAGAIAHEERTILGNKGGGDAQWQVHNRMVLNNNKSHKHYINDKDDPRLHDATFDTVLLEGIWDTIGTNKPATSTNKPAVDPSMDTGGNSDSHDLKLSSNNTLLLDIPGVKMFSALSALPPDFDAKSEFHSTILGFPFAKIMKKHMDKKDEVQKLIDESDFSYTFDNILYRIAKDYKANPTWNIEAHTRESVIRKIDMPGAKIFIDKLNKLLNENIPEPFPHVTLGTKGHTDGIGIASEKAFEDMNPVAILKSSGARTKITEDSLLDGKFFEYTPVTKTQQNKRTQDKKAFEFEPKNTSLNSGDWDSIMRRIVEIGRASKNSDNSDWSDIIDLVKTDEYQHLLRTMLGSAAMANPTIAEFFKKNAKAITPEAYIPQYNDVTHKIAPINAEIILLKFKSITLALKKYYLTKS